MGAEAMAEKERQRLDKVLAHIGIGSRKEIKKLCKDGRVKVNGEFVKDSGLIVHPYQDTFEVDGEEVRYREFIYLMMNKPQGVISATEDLRTETVVDLLEPEDQVFEPSPVGRLDKDTEGLLLLTNDGQLAHQLLSPKKHVPKTYYAKIDGIVSEQDIEAFREGVVLEDGYKTMPGELIILHAAEESEIELTIYEGKFHQVKRMFEAVGKRVTYLKRISMGPLPLDESLKPGEYRELTDEEVQMLRDARD
jgi:16S rRNA pseudouridine516 synthase